MNFNELLCFTKEFKHLAKKYPSLPDDLDAFTRIVSVSPMGNGKHFNTLTKCGQCAIVKARFFCRYLKGSSLRIVYAFHEQDNRCMFLEIYSKSEKLNEDRGRIKEYLKDAGMLK